MGLFDGQVAAITGASGGIGAHAARMFAAEGAAVVIMARRGERVRAVVEEIRAAGGRAEGFAGDAGSRADCERLIQTAVDSFGGVDILLNNAGMPDFHLTATIVDDEMWEENIATHQSSAMYCCRAALPYMEKKGKGVIINMASMSATTGNCGISSCATKAAIIGMTKNIGLEYTGTGIRCNAIAPGVVRQEGLPGEPPPDPYKLSRNVPFFKKVQRHADFTIAPSTIDEQVDVIRFLASDASRAITGQCIMTDKGISL